MKKIVAIVLVVLLLIGMVACGEEKPTLHCDGDGCDNTVVGKEGMDESWVVFCEDCEKNVLAD